MKKVSIRNRICLAFVNAAIFSAMTSAESTSAVSASLEAVDVPVEALLQFVDSTVANKIENQETLDSINDLLKQGDEKLSCRSIVYGGSRTIPILNDQGEVVPSITFFVMTWIKKDDDRDLLPDFETSVHLLTAVSIYSERGELKSRSTIADMRRRVKNEWALDVYNKVITRIPVLNPEEFDVKEVVREAVKDNAENLPNELQAALNGVPDQAQAMLANWIGQIEIRPNDFSEVGGQPVRQVRFIGCEKPQQAVLVATFFTADMATYHVVRGKHGMAMREEWQFTKVDGASQWGDGNNREDAATPGRHFVTIYLGPGATIPHLGTRGANARNGLGFGWSDRMATMWVQPGQAYKGERVRLHADRATDNEIVRDFAPGFYCLSFYQWKGADSMVHEKASGLSVR